MIDKYGSSRLAMLGFSQIGQKSWPRPTFLGPLGHYSSLGEAKPGSKPWRTIWGLSRKAICQKYLYLWTKVNPKTCTKWGPSMTFLTNRWTGSSKTGFLTTFGPPFWPLWPFIALWGPQRVAKKECTIRRYFMFWYTFLVRSEVPQRDINGQSLHKGWVRFWTLPWDPILDIWPFISLWGSLRVIKMMYMMKKWVHVFERHFWLHLCYPERYKWP